MIMCVTVRGEMSKAKQNAANDSYSVLLHPSITISVPSHAIRPTKERGMSSQSKLWLFTCYLLFYGILAGILLWLSHVLFSAFLFALRVCSRASAHTHTHTLIVFSLHLLSRPSHFAFLYYTSSHSPLPFAFILHHFIISSSSIFPLFLKEKEDTNKQKKVIIKME